MGDELSDPPQRLLSSGHLRQDLNTGPVGIEHPLQPVDLSPKPHQSTADRTLPFITYKNFVWDMQLSRFLYTLTL